MTAPLPMVPKAAQMPLVEAGDRLAEAMGKLREAHEHCGDCLGAKYLDMIEASVAHSMEDVVKLCNMAQHGTPERRKGPGR